MDQNDLELREVARKRVEARLGLHIHLAMYVLVNAGLVVTWWVTGARYPWFIWPLLGWGVGVAGHLLGYLYGPGSSREERAISREVRRLRERTP